MSGKNTRLTQADVLEGMERFVSIPGWRERLERSNPAALDAIRERLTAMLESYDALPWNPWQEQIRYLAVGLLEQIDEPKRERE